MSDPWDNLLVTVEFFWLKLDNRSILYAFCIRIYYGLVKSVGIGVTISRKTAPFSRVGKITDKYPRYCWFEITWEPTAILTSICAKGEVLHPSWSHAPSLLEVVDKTGAYYQRPHLLTFKHRRERLPGFIAKAGRTREYVIVVEVKTRSKPISINPTGPEALENR